MLPSTSPCFSGTATRRADASFRSLKWRAKSRSMLRTCERYSQTCSSATRSPSGSAILTIGFKEVLQWTEAYRTAVGEPLTFFHADMTWDSPLWSEQLKALSSYTHAKGIKLGIIYNGAGKTGMEWTRTAEQRFMDVESRLKIVPNLAIIQTWDPQPDHMMPDSQPGTLTNLVLRYSAWQRKR
jgi:hypothetical protein